MMPPSLGHLPDAHARSGNLGKADRSRETLVTLGIIVLETNLQLDRLEEVSLLLVEGILEELLDIRTHSGYHEPEMSAKFWMFRTETTRG